MGRNDEVNYKLRHLYATGKKMKLLKTPLNVALQKTDCTWYDVTNWLLLPVILTSKNETVIFLKSWGKFNVYVFHFHKIHKIV